MFLPGDHRRRRCLPCKHGILPLCLCSLVLVLITWKPPLPQLSSMYIFYSYLYLFVYVFCLEISAGGGAFHASTGSFFFVYYFGLSFDHINATAGCGVLGLSLCSRIYSNYIHMYVCVYIYIYVYVYISVLPGGAEEPGYNKNRVDP